MLPGFMPTSATYDDVMVAFNDLLHLEEDHTIRIALAAFIANKLSTDPVWLFLVAPSASAKSEIVRSLSLLPGSIELSSLTEKTFLSGFKGAKGSDPSLLAKVNHGDVFLLKDFTTILSMRQDVRASILADLREIFDGKIEKNFGNDISRSWRGKVGFIAGVTYVIEDLIMMSASYGDRFLYWKMPATDIDLAMDKASAVIGQEEEKRAWIREKVAGFFMEAIKGAKTMAPPASVIRGVRELCKFSVIARAPVNRDPYGSRALQRVGQAESPMRMAKELQALANGLMILRGGVWHDDDWPLLAKASLDSIPSWRMNVLRALQSRRDEWMTTVDLGLLLKLPTTTTRSHAEDLECHGVVDRFAGGSGTAHHWRLSDMAVRLLSYELNPTPSVIRRDIPPDPIIKEETTYDQD